ncbi:MAG TPA: pyridoxamine 5'-phosphate oxidase family protein [Thermomicrobiales bacterium]|nr:pyridoxamine 5'-phosphate oxidase family protein [Thermomicrobiales bacterium]
MAITFDQQNPAHQTALRKLESDQIAWLTTIRSGGRPHSVPVWFLWHDGELLVFSESETVKTRNVRGNANAVMNLHATPDGGEVVILDGTAAISDRDTAGWLATVGEAYERKYAGGLWGLGLTLEQMAAQYSAVIVFTPTKLSAW